MVSRLSICIIPSCIILRRPNVVNPKFGLNVEAGHTFSAVYPKQLDYRMGLLKSSWCTLKYLCARQHNRLASHFSSKRT